MNMASSQDLSTLTKTWRKLVPVVKYGLRRNINSVGGINARHLDNALKEVYLPHHTMLSRPLVSTRSSMSPSNLMAVWIQTTARDVFLRRSMSKGYRRIMRKQCHPPAKTQTPSRSEFRLHTTHNLAKLL